MPSDKGKWSLTDQPPSPSGRHLFDALISARLGPDLATFDDDHAVANAGLLQPATLAEHLGLRELFDEYVDLGNAPGHANVGLKAMTLVQSLLVVGGAISSDTCRR